MAQTDATLHALLVTDATLRATFPSDFHKRCMYASVAIASLLEDAGLEAEVAGGDFMCAVVSTDGRQLSLQGFGTSGVGESSHYWVHANALHIDPGPAYLPYESPYLHPRFRLSRGRTPRRFPMCWPTVSGSGSSLMQRFQIPPLQRASATLLPGVARVATPAPCRIASRSGFCVTWLHCDSGPSGATLGPWLRRHSCAEG